MTIGEGLKAALLYGGGWLLGMLLIVNSFALAFACQWLGLASALRPARKADVQKWAERARLTYPVWSVFSVGPWLLAILSFAFTATSLDRIEFPWSRRLAMISAASALLGAALVSVQTESRLKGWTIRLRDWLYHDLILCLVFLPHVLVLIPIAISMPNHFGDDLWMYAFITSGGILFYVLSGGLFVLRLLRLATPPPEPLKRAMDAAISRVGTKPKATYLIRWKTVNAVAFPVINRIAVSDTALKHLTGEELVAVCVHELGHLMESPRVKCLRILGAFVWSPLIFAKPIVSTYGFIGLAVTISTVFFCHYGVRALSRAMERKADALGQAHEGDPGTYAKALEHLYQLNLIPAVTHHKQPTHPHLYDRLLAAHVVPSYPRPNRPAQWLGWLSLLVMAFCAVIWSLACGAAIELILE